MIKFISKMFFIVALSILFIGCSEETNSAEGVNINDIVVQSSKLPSKDIYAGSLHKVELEIYSPLSISADDNESSIFFFLSLVDVNDENNTIWFDTDSLSLIQEGTHFYDFDLHIPYDMNASRYFLNVSISDSESVLYEYKSSDFEVLAHDNKPELEILSITLDLEHSGFDSEFDDITSSEINATAISLLAEELSAMPIEILNQDEPLEISSTIRFISNIVDASDVNISACMELDSECIDIPILQVISTEDNVSISAEDEDNVSIIGTVEPLYSSQIQLGYLEANVEKSLSLDFLIGVDDVASFVSKLLTKIATNSNAVLDATLKVTIETDNESIINPTENNTLSYPLNLFLHSDFLYTLTNPITEFDSNLTLDDLNASDLNLTLNDINQTIDEINSTIADANISDTNLSDLVDINIAIPFPSASLASSQPRTTSGECGLKKLKYEKEYEKKKYGKRFGAGAYLLGRGWLDADGVHGKAYASIRIRRFSDTKWRIFRMNATADIDPSSFSDTGYDIELSSLGKVIYTKSNSLLESAGLDEPIVTLTTEEERRISLSSTDTNTTDSNTTDSNTTTTVTTRETLLKQKRIKAVKDKLKTYTTTSTTNLSLVSLERNWRVGKSTERTTTIMFAIIPIVVTAGAEARIGYDAEISLDGITSISAMLEPNAYIGAYLEAGVGASISCCWVNINYSAGAGSYLWLLSERFTTTVVGSLRFVEDGDYIVELKGALNQNITNYLSTMKGKTYAYASFYGPYKWSKPTDSDWKNRRRTKTFADWEGGKYTATLLDKNWNIFSIPLADECD